MASVFLEEIKQEIKIRIQAYKARKRDLEQGVSEIPVLVALIDEAQAELAAIKARVPDEPSNPT